MPHRNVLLERVLSLREGSIIVVTLLVAIYFALDTSTFLTVSSFKTLLPFFAPFAILAVGDPGAGLLRGGRLRQRVLDGGRRHQLVRDHARHALHAGGADADHLACPACRAAGRGTDELDRRRPQGDQRGAHRAQRNGQPRLDVRKNLRRGHLLRADLGGRDRDRRPDRVDVHPLGPVHGGRGLEQAGRRRGRGAGAPGDDPQLHALQHGRRSRGDPRRRAGRSAGA